MLSLTWRPRTIGQRWCLEDGAIPARIRGIAEDEIPGQTMFTIDGDAAVPALFLSRAFRIWAWATTTRSTSWSARFSITRTFETFPLPDGFVVSHEEPYGGRPCVIFDQDAAPLRSRAEEFAREVDSRPTYWRDDRHPHDLEDIDATILEGYGLSPAASAIDILRRLVRLNEFADDHCH